MDGDGWTVSEERIKELEAKLKEANGVLKIVYEVLEGRRFDSLDQNPSGIRDLVYATISKTEL